MCTLKDCRILLQLSIVRNSYEEDPLAANFWKLPAPLPALFSSPRSSCQGY